MCCFLCPWNWVKENIHYITMVSDETVLEQKVTENWTTNTNRAKSRVHLLREVENNNLRRNKRWEKKKEIMSPLFTSRIIIAETLYPVLISVILRYETTMFHHFWTHLVVRGNDRERGGSKWMEIDWLIGQSHFGQYCQSGILTTWVMVKELRRKVSRPLSLPRPIRDDQSHIAQCWTVRISIVHRGAMLFNKDPYCSVYISIRILTVQYTFQ